MLLLTIRERVKEACFSSYVQYLDCVLEVLRFEQVPRHEVTSNGSRDDLVAHRRNRVECEGLCQKPVINRPEFIQQFIWELKFGALNYHPVTVEPEGAAGELAGARVGGEGQAVRQGCLHQVADDETVLEHELSYLCD
jgi:hypothetical protein